MRAWEEADYIWTQGLMRIVESVRGGLLPECEALCERQAVTYEGGAMHCPGHVATWEPDVERVSPACEKCPCYDPEPEWLV